MTTKKQEVRKVPNLRFPGFDGEWEEKQLGSLLEFKNGINASKENYGRGVKFINVLDILNNNFITYDKIIGSVDVQQNVADKYSVNYGDILFQRSSETREEVGTANVYLDREHTATFGGFVIRGRKIGNYNPVFLNELLKTGSARDSITSKSGGSTRFNVGQEILSSIKLLFPEINEQTKIADFLSICDERIEQSSKIIQKLESLILQFIEKTLNQQIRFENQDHFPSWTTHKLGDIGETYNGLTNKTKEDFGIGKPYIQYKQIFDQSKIDISRCGLVDVVSSENQNRVRKGDVFFTTSSETPEEIGMASVLLDDIEEMYLNSFCFGYRLNSTDILSPYFARFLFRSKNFRTEIIKLAQGSTRYNMSKIEMMKIEVHLPCLTEQILIADFLTSIEDKIVTEKQILDQYKNQKAYLLQNMVL